MLDLDDPAWTEMEGVYGPYDPRPALARFETGQDIDAVWSEFWENLHHQGDIPTVAYATLPHLVRIYQGREPEDWNLFALAATFEENRHWPRNPPIPEVLEEPYRAAWRLLEEMALRLYGDAADATMTTSLLAVLAHARGHRLLGEMCMLGEEELAEMLGHA